jgi:AcrR family transcriptional regulator
MKDTKEIILKTAYDLFLSINYEAVTINSIIKATGLTKGGIYHYFASKEEIFKAVVDRYMTENTTDLSVEHATLKDLIDYTIQKIKNQMQRKKCTCFDNQDIPPLQYVSLIVTAMRFYPEYVEIKNNFLIEEINKWKRVIEKAIENKEIRSDIDVEVSAVNFLLSSAGIVAHIVFSGSTEYALNMYERQLNEMYKMLKI